MSNLNLGTAFYYVDFTTKYSANAQTDHSCDMGMVEQQYLIYSLEHQPQRRRELGTPFWQLFFWTCILTPCHRGTQWVLGLMGLGTSAFLGKRWYFLFNATIFHHTYLYNNIAIFCLDMRIVTVMLGLVGHGYMPKKECSRPGGL